MRVLHVVPTYLPAVRYGGPAIATHALCASLVRRGCEVTVFTTNVDGSVESAVPVAVPVDMEGVAVWYFPVSAFRRLYHSPAMARALRERCETFDLLHVHSVYVWPTWAAAREARRRRVPYLVAPRGMLVEELIARKSSLVKRAWIRLIERRNLEHAAGIHVTSAVEGAEVRRFGFALPPIHEVPNGVGDEAATQATSTLPARAAEVLARGRPVVLFLGRINWKKGLDRLIPAMAHVPEAELLIAGNDDEGYASRLMAIARSSGVEQRTSFCGAVYGAAKARLYRRAALLCLPSYSENFGNVVLEAMFEGCPVVVTAAVGAASVVEELGGGVVSEGDPVSLGESLRRLLGDRMARTAMGGRAQRAVRERYTWDRVAARMDQVYRQVALWPDR